jgi:hypothetical protein
VDIQGRLGSTRLLLLFKLTLSVLRRGPLTRPPAIVERMRAQVMALLLNGRARAAEESTVRFSVTAGANAWVIADINVPGRVHGTRNATGTDGASFVASKPLGCPAGPLRVAARLNGAGVFSGSVDYVAFSSE